MPNLTTVLNEEIRRLARKEIRDQVGKTVKQVASQRRDIAELKRLNTKLQGRVAYLEKREKQRIAQPGAAKPAAGKSVSAGGRQAETSARFSPKWLASHREKLDLSAADYAKLVGCSPLSIYKWEKGETEPRTTQRDALAAIRGLGKREAMRQLELLED